MMYPQVDRELLGKKIVAIHGDDSDVYTVIKVGDHQVEAHKTAGGSTWAYWSFSQIRLATQEESAMMKRGKCPHKYRSYLEIIKNQNIPYGYQVYKTDYSKPSMMSVNAWVCDWCGQHIDRDTNKILKEGH